jgi:nucleoside-diphosphate-sugar epimerase
MKILFIGGTGIISTACTALAAERGLDITLLSRGRHASELPAGVKTLIADVNDPALLQKLERESFDAVVDWIAFTPADIERDLKLFRGRTT